MTSPKTMTPMAALLDALKVVEHIGNKLDTLHDGKIDKWGSYSKAFDSLVEERADALTKVDQLKKKMDRLEKERNAALTIVRNLIKHGANLDVKNAKGLTALHVAAAAKSQLEMVYCLVISKADTEIMDNDSNTALHLAAEKGHLSVVKCLVKNGTSKKAKNTDAKDKETKNKKGNTALHLAAINKHPNVVRYLIERGDAKKDTTDNDNNTALHLAAKNGSLGVVLYLIKPDADKKAKNKKAKNKKANNTEANNTEAKNTDEKYTGAKNNDGNTALDLAAINGHLGVVKCLIEMGDATDNDCNIALGLAKGDVVDYLEKRALKK